MLVYLCRYLCVLCSSMVPIQMKCTHLRIVKESYVKHLCFTIYLFAVLFLLSLAAIVHGFIPWILTGTVSDKVKELNSTLNERWVNPK